MSCGLSGSYIETAVGFPGGATEMITKFLIKQNHFFSKSVHIKMRTTK